jgi:exonuclease III
MIYSRSVCTINIAAIECLAKKNLLQDFINENDFDVIFLQEVVFTNFDIFYGYEVIVNNGSAARGTAVLIRNGIDCREILLSICGRIISFMIGDTIFVNVYPISGGQYTRERRDFFLNEIIPHFNKPNANNMIIAGDFNCILDSADTRGATKIICYELKRMVETMELSDIYNKFSRYFTHRQFTFH